MGKFRFCALEEMDREEMLPALFRILYRNMNGIVPSDQDYEADERAWMAYILPSLEEGDTKVILMYRENSLAGYFQYRIVGDTLCADEVEVKEEYQRTFLFFRLCQYLRCSLPENVRYVSSYVNKKNDNSIAIHEKLGMVRMGENRTGSSWYYRGERKAMEERFR